ncbi:MAG: hypothetical protein ACRC77_00860 [Bacteroidales bacterium]
MEVNTMKKPDVMEVILSENNRLTQLLLSEAYEMANEDMYAIPVRIKQLCVRKEVLVENYRNQILIHDHFKDEMRSLLSAIYCQVILARDIAIISSEKEGELKTQIRRLASLIN